MNEINQFSDRKDILGQEILPVYIRTEEIENEKKEKIDYSKVYLLPSIKTRYISIFIDTVTIILLSFGLSKLFDSIENVPDFIRGLTFVVAIILYEPILVSIGATFGQVIMNIRVRSFKNPNKKLNFLLVTMRFILKLLLGWISFLTISFNPNRRAIHDFASGSIMIEGKIEE